MDIPWSESSILNWIRLPTFWPRFQIDRHRIVPTVWILAFLFCPPSPHNLAYIDALHHWSLHTVSDFSCLREELWIPSFDCSHDISMRKQNVIVGSVRYASSLTSCRNECTRPCTYTYICHVTPQTVRLKIFCIFIVGPSYPPESLCQVRTPLSFVMSNGTRTKSYSDSLPPPEALSLADEFCRWQRPTDSNCCLWGYDFAVGLLLITLFYEALVQSPFHSFAIRQECTMHICLLKTLLVALVPIGPLQPIQCEAPSILCMYIEDGATGHSIHGF